MKMKMTQLRELIREEILKQSLNEAAAQKAAEECANYVIQLLKKDMGGDEREFAVSLLTDPTRKLQKKYDELCKKHWPKFRDKYKLPKDTKIEEL